MKKHTKSAFAYVAHYRQKEDRAATWIDVADAYDAGLRHGLALPSSAIKQLEEAGYQVSDLARRHVMRRIEITEQNSVE